MEVTPEMGKITAKEDNLLLRKIVNEQLKDKLRQMLFLISTNKQNSPKLDNYEEKKKLILDYLVSNKKNYRRCKENAVRFIYLYELLMDMVLINMNARLLKL